MSDLAIVAFEGQHTADEVLLRMRKMALDWEVDLDELIREAQIEGVISTPAYSGTIDRFAYQSDTMRTDMQRAEAVSRLSVEIADSVVSQAEAYTKAKDVKAVKTFVRSGDIAEAILDVASEAEADLIVMGHERRSVLGDLIHSSVALAVDKKAKCPCLVLSQ